MLCANIQSAPLTNGAGPITNCLSARPLANGFEPISNEELAPITNLGIMRLTNGPEPFGNHPQKYATIWYRISYNNLTRCCIILI